MSTYHIKKPSFLEVSRNQSTPTTSLNTTDISLNNTNLENYKKALSSIVKRLNKTPSASSKTSLKRSESKLNQTQQPVYSSNTTFLNTSNSSKKYHIANTSTYASKNQSSSKRSHSNEGNYMNSKELLNKSMQEPYLRKGSFSSNIAKSISINKLDKENQEQIDTGDREPHSVDTSNHYRKNSALNSTILQDVDFHNLDGEGDKKLRDLVHQYQLRDAIHRQEISKLKNSNELLRTHVYELEKELDRSKKNKDSERRYINRLEAELNQIKERVRLEAEKNSMVTTLSDQKENQYIKMIEDLKSQITSISSEKKLTEHLLKNALTQHDPNKLDIKSQAPNSGTHKGLDPAILASTAGKYSTNAGGRPKAAADPFARKSSAIKIYNDENDYASYSQSHSVNSSFVMNSVKASKDLDSTMIKENRQPAAVKASENLGRILQEGGMNSAVELPTEGDEAFPNKVFPPQLNQKSLKERMDMNQFKLDLSVISKNRKVG